MTPQPGDALMSKALCWEIGQRVPVALAVSLPRYRYFCTEPRCLAQVHPRHTPRKDGGQTLTFAANTRHAQGCPFDRSGQGSSGLGGLSGPYPDADDEWLPPTRLGPAALPVNRTDPTPAELLALALRTELVPVEFPGTLAQVAAAHHAMPSYERRGHPLYIAGQAMDYWDAFELLRSVNTYTLREVLAVTDRILFFEADMRRAYGRIYLNSRPSFSHNGATRRLSFSLPDLSQFQHALGFAPQLQSLPITLYSFRLPLGFEETERNFQFTLTDLPPHHGIALTPRSDRRS